MDNQEQANQKPKRLKTIIIILAVLLVLSAGGLAARMIYLYLLAPAQATVTLPDNLIGENSQTGEAADPAGSRTETSRPADGNAASGQISPNPDSDSPAKDKLQAAKLELYKGQPGDNERFEVQNLFPGDSVTKYFCLKVYHDANISLFFKADVIEQTKSLGDALHIKVTRLGTGKVLCDAPFSKISGQEFTEALLQNALGETTAYYQIDVSLDTSAGNEYQAAMLKADFAWYIKEEGGLTPPQTGDHTIPALWAVLALSALLLLLILWKRGKGDEQHG